MHRVDETPSLWLVNIGVTLTEDQRALINEFMTMRQARRTRYGYRRTSKPYDDMGLKLSNQALQVLAALDTDKVKSSSEWKIDAYSLLDTVQPVATIINHHKMKLERLGLIERVVL